LEHLRGFVKLVDESSESKDRGPAETHNGSSDHEFINDVQFRMQPDGGQREGRQSEKHQHDERCSEIPWQRMVLNDWQGWQGWRQRTLGWIEKFKAVLALDGLILDFFRAIGTFFHVNWEPLIVSFGWGQGRAKTPMIRKWFPWTFPLHPLRAKPFRLLKKRLIHLILVAGQATRNLQKTRAGC
jgi:hypothetical protein